MKNKMKLCVLMVCLSVFTEYEAHAVRVNCENGNHATIKNGYYTCWNGQTALSSTQCSNASIPAYWRGSQTPVCQPTAMNGYCPIDC